MKRGWPGDCPLVGEEYFEYLRVRLPTLARQLPPLAPPLISLQLLIPPGGYSYEVAPPAIGRRANFAETPFPPAPVPLLPPIRVNLRALAGSHRTPTT